MSYEEKISMLSVILKCLQESAARQSDEGARKYGCKELMRSIHYVKLLIKDVENEILICQMGEGEAGLGLFNLQ